jgi:hypothetical protein
MADATGTFMWVILRFFVALVVVGSGCITAFAQGYSGITHAIENKDWVTASNLAITLDEEAKTGSFFFLYVTATKFSVEDNCAEAIPIIDALKQAKPSFAPLHELGYICNTKLGKSAAAKSDLQKLVAILPNGQERDLIRGMLEAEHARSKVSVGVYGSVTPSSNANKQTSVGYINGLEVTSGSKASKGVNATIGATFTKVLNQTQTSSFAGVVRTEIGYSTVDQVISPRLALEAPLAFSMNENASAVLTPFFDLHFLGTKHSHTKIGTKGIVRQKLDDTNSMAYQAEISRNNYVDAHYLNGFYFHGSVSWERNLSETTSLTLSTGLNSVLTDRVARQSHKIEAKARLEHSAANGLTFGAEASAGVRFHNQPAPLTTTGNQTDQFLRTQFELSHKDITFGAFRPVLAYTFQVQESDNIFYKHESHDLGISLRANF